MKKSYESRVWLLAEIEPAFSLSHEETYYQRRSVLLAVRPLELFIIQGSLGQNARSVIKHKIYLINWTNILANPIIINNEIMSD